MTQSGTGRVSLVSGGSRGIGRAICIALAHEHDGGVAINYQKNEEAAKEVVARVEGLGVKARAYRADVSNEEQSNIMLEQVLKDFGRVDVLVNNAGITQDRSFLKMTRDQWHQVLLVNLDSVFNLTQPLLSQMIERQWGRIINITSIVGQIGNFGQANYAVSKGGLTAFTKTLAREVARKGITVNAVAPGYIETDMTAVVPENTLNQIRELTPMGRLGRPEEVARAVRFLAADEASFITGECVNVNGGLYMQ